jgi:hypothetical protein
MNYGLLFQTVAHLKPQQVYYQIVRRISKPKYAQMSAPVQGARLKQFVTEPIARPHSLDGEAFEFLNIRKAFDGWNDTSNGMLWAYNLNYFDYLNQAGMSEAEGISWIDEFIKSLPVNRIGLDPYPTALRLENWIKFFCRYPEAASSQRLDSLYSQYIHLQHSLEKHLLGNHLLEDYYSLYIASLFFSDDKYHRKVSAWLLSELSEEILSDGGHYEQSPMYHCILLDRLLDCINAKMTFGEPDSDLKSLKIFASQMLGYLEAICFSDGSYPLFNDSALGIAPTPCELWDYAQRLGIEWDKKAVLGASGYRKLSDGQIEAIVDVGDITATYQPGHTHADVLNFEVRISGTPFIVDSGISTYNKTARRQAERSTSAHNCITIGGRDCAEVWGGFRVAGRYRVQLTDDVSQGVSALVGCCGGESYSRSFSFAGGALCVEDSLVDGGSELEGVSRLHLAPEVKVLDIMESGDATVVPTSAGKITVSGASSVKVVPCKVSREYNRLLPSSCIEMAFSEHLKYTIER